MTEALYYQDPLARDTSARVTHVARDSAHTMIELDRTVLYPEGGGQPGDRGLLHWKGTDLAIDDTVKQDGRILHRIASADALPQPGTEVTVTVDWDHRWEYMQQHTGQHLLSAALLSALDAPTVAVHQGHDATTIEVERDGIGDDEISQLTEVAADSIARDAKVRSFEIDESELHHYSLRRETKRSGRIRLVEIDGIDLVACGGVHLPRTALVELIIPLGLERIRGRSRISFAIGRRAVRYALSTHRSLTAIAARFSAGVADTYTRVVAMERETLELRGEIRRRTVEVAEHHVAAIVENGERLRVFESLDAETFSAVAQGVGERTTTPIALINTLAQPAQWALCLPQTADLSTQTLRTRVLDGRGAKGGGRPPLFRGVVPIDGSDAAAEFAGQLLAAAES